MFCVMISEFCVMISEFCVMISGFYIYAAQLSYITPPLCLLHIIK
jgi:hypothetical protein